MVVVGNPNLRRWSMLKGIVTKRSQHEVLQGRMMEAGIQHGERVRANLTGVRVYPLASPVVAEVRFCFMGNIQTLGEPLVAGDSGPLASKAWFTGLSFQKYGVYAIENCILDSNGHNTIIIDEKSKVRFVRELPRVNVLA